jgi:hypothetical protein
MFSRTISARRAGFLGQPGLAAHGHGWQVEVVAAAFGPLVVHNFGAESRSRPEAAGRKPGRKTADIPKLVQQAHGFRKHHTLNKLVLLG